MKLTVGSKVRWRILLSFFKPLENMFFHGDLALSTGMQVSNWPFLKQKLQDLLSSVMTTALLLPNVACMTGSFNERHLYCLIWLSANFWPFSLRVFVRQSAYTRRRCNNIRCWSTWLSCKVINIPLVDDEDVVDTATLRDAKPLGILRVVVAWPSWFFLEVAV